MGTPPTFVSETMPLALGSPLKVPSYAWTNWGATWSTGDEYSQLLVLSDDAYRDEWRLTTAQGHDDIALAAVRAGLGDANQRLNNAVAEIVASEVAARRGYVRLLDVGAGSGNTTLTALDRTEDPGRLVCTLLDPASSALASAGDRLEQRSLVLGKHFFLINTPDMEGGRSLGAGSFDVIVSAAALHHHADIQKPLEALGRLLAPGGLLVIGDWHNTLWEHPWRVLNALQSLHWPTKEADLHRFAELYSAANEPAQEESVSMRSANALIANFWVEYATARTTEEPQFCMLEGHRPVDRYAEALRSIGLETIPVNAAGETGNPILLPPERCLLGVTAGRKQQNGTNRVS